MHSRTEVTVVFKSQIKEQGELTKLRFLEQVQRVLLRSEGGEN